MAIPAYEGGFVLIFFCHLQLPVSTTEVQAAKDLSTGQLVYQLRSSGKWVPVFLSQRIYSPVIYTKT